MVVSVKEKAKQDFVRYVLRRRNASEPLRTCRKRRDDVKTEGESLTRDKFWGSLFTAQAASGMEKA